MFFPLALIPISDVLAAERRTLFAWQRTSLACVLFGVVLTRGFGADVPVGVIFWLLGVVIEVASAFYDGIQMRRYNLQNRIIVKNTLIWGVSLIAVLADAALLSVMWMNH